MWTAVLSALVFVAVAMAAASFVREWMRPLDQPVTVTVERPKDDRSDRMYDPRNAQPVPIYSVGCVHRWEVVKDETLDVGHQKKMVVILRCPECGLLHETVEATDPAPKVDPPRSECRHEWTVDKAVEIDSAYEQMHESLRILSSVKGQGQPGSQMRERWEQAMKKAEGQVLPDPNRTPAWVFRKEYVQVRTCRKCGEVKVVQASNLPDLERLGEGRDDG